MSASFSEYTRIIGRGPTLSRPLTRAEARAAMGLVLDGRVEPLQLGGFLLVLRQRGETAEELAGFAEAARDRMALPSTAPAPDVDWPTYADKHRQQPWFVLAALLLAKYGFTVFMHGIAGEAADCAPTRPVLAALGIRPSGTLAAAAEDIERAGFAYAPLEGFAPATEALFHCKPFLGVRSVANTFARDLNPLAATLAMVGIVHAPYRPLHQRALALLGQRKAAVFKGIGGEAQRNPFKAGQVAVLDDGRAEEQTWPAILTGEAFLWREEDLSPDRVAALWRGDIEHPAAEASIAATAAIVLRTFGAAATAEDAHAAGQELWRHHRSGADPAGHALYAAAKSASARARAASIT